MAETYQPKLNPEMLTLGYLGANPNAVGLTGGYSTRMTPPTPKKPENKNQRKNPYMK